MNLCIYFAVFLQSPMLACYGSRIFQILCLVLLLYKSENTFCPLPQPNARMDASGIDHRRQRCSGRTEASRDRLLLGNFEILSAVVLFATNLQTGADESPRTSLHCRANWICSGADDRTRNHAGARPACYLAHAGYSTCCGVSEWCEDGTPRCCFPSSERFDHSNCPYLFFPLLIGIAWQRSPDCCKWQCGTAVFCFSDLCISGTQPTISDSV